MHFSDDFKTRHQDLHSKLLHRIIPPALTSSYNNAHQQHSTTNPDKINNNVINQGTPVIDKQLQQFRAAGKHPDTNHYPPNRPTTLPNIQQLSATPL